MTGAFSKQFTGTLIQHKEMAKDAERKEEVVATVSTDTLFTTSVLLGEINRSLMNSDRYLVRCILFLRNHNGTRASSSMTQDTPF